MNSKIELALLNATMIFKGMVLRSTLFKEKDIKGRKLLTAEFIFSDQEQKTFKTMVLVLDKDVTTGDYQDIYEEVIT